jgi:hypothetical protein
MCCHFAPFKMEDARRCLSKWWLRPKPAVRAEVATVFPLMIAIT